MTTRLHLVDVLAETLHRLNPQLPGHRVLAERSIDELIDQGLIQVDSLRGWQGAPRQQRMIGPATKP